MDSARSDERGRPSFRAHGGTILAVIGVTAALAGAFAWKRAHAASGPALRLESGDEVVDLGTFDGATELAHVFRLRNASDAPIELSRIARSCSCAAAEPTVSVLAPGASTDLRIRADVGGRSGPFEAIVHVFEGPGAGAAALRLGIRADLGRGGSLVLEPSTITWDAESPPESVRVRVRRTGAARGAGSLVLPKTTLATLHLVDTVVDPAFPAGSGGAGDLEELIVVPSAASSAGQGAEVLVLSAQHQGRAFQDRLALHVTTRRDVAGVAERVWLGSVAPATEGDATLDIDLPPGDDVEAWSLDCASGRARIVESAASADGDSMRVRIACTAAEPGLFEVPITLRSAQRTSTSTLVGFGVARVEDRR